jgi:DNA-binding XRE family transcriptional regulator
MAIDKEKAGQELYNADWPQKDIARILDVSEKTVVNWKQKNDWDKKRAKKNMAEEVSEDGIWELINYQITALKMKKNRFEEQLSKEEITDLPVLDKGDVDALQKLWTTVKGKQLEWSTVVRIIRDFVAAISEKDNDLAKSILTHTDEYLNFKRKNL